MNASEQVDQLIEMVKRFFSLDKKIIFNTPEYCIFHKQVTEFVYKNNLDEGKYWKIISENLLYKSTQYLVDSEANIILECLEGIKRDLLKKENEPFWKYIHPYIKDVSKSKFIKGEYCDSVESALKEINNRLKLIVINKTGREYDGADLMRKVFSVNDPIIKLDDLSYQSGRNVQEGYMEMFAGAIIGIRNPKAHKNRKITKEDAVRKLHFASMLMYKVDSAIM